MINYYQQGGKQDPIAQVIQALASDDQQMQAQAFKAIQESGQADQIIQEIANRAQQGDQAATKAVALIDQVIKSARAKKAKYGAKLNYIKQLKGICPEGFEMAYFKAGGKVCSKCVRAQKEACGGKTKKMKK